jgi:hypothetical protein
LFRELSDLYPWLVAITLLLPAITLKKNFPALFFKTLKDFFFLEFNIKDFAPFVHALLVVYA